MPLARAALIFHVLYHHAVAPNVPQLALALCLAPNRLTQNRRDGIQPVKERSLKAGSTRIVVHLVKYYYHSKLEYYNTIVIFHQGVYNYIIITKLIIYNNIKHQSWQ